MSANQGILEKTIETVSETFHGAAEGLKHGTEVLTGHASHAAVVTSETASQTANQGMDTATHYKEQGREKAHEMTSVPTPLNPSYADMLKDKVKEGMEMLKPEENVPRGASRSA